VPALLVSAAALVAAASGGEAAPGPAPPARRVKGSASVDAEAPLKAKRRARHSGEHGEKTAQGKPKPDEPTVELLTRRPGWFESEDEAVAVLTRAKTGHNRFPLKTALRMVDWLEATLGPEPVKDGMCPGARAVKVYPDLLTKDAATLQRNWEALQEALTLSPELGREAVRKYPQVLSCPPATLQRGWSMLTATDGGLGLSAEDARSCIILNPRVLFAKFEDFTRCVELLRSLGFEDAHRMALAHTTVIDYGDDCVRAHAAWWRQSGLDHLKIVAMQPTLLGGVAIEELQAKLDFLIRVVGMSTAELNNASSLFGRKLNERLRARYFYARLKGKLACVLAPKRDNRAACLHVLTQARCPFCLCRRFGSINTMMQPRDEIFLAMLQGRPLTTKELASDDEVARYKRLIASERFLALMDCEEEQLRRSSAEHTAV